ncbi:sensor histidine kinase [Lunatibacter salilacus]|uniref:sensor histidine kinase n=1 Tax=Lunatibacter salilacus TaxID=2483804 RepID=UPI00131C073A|nr:HAMP domain-containing sensor histidine kinase [Lunatibacter salilacus]
MCEENKRRLTEINNGKKASNWNFGLGIGETVNFVNNQQFFIFKCDISGNILYLNNSLERLIPESIRKDRFPFGYFLDEEQKGKLVETIQSCIEFSEVPKIVNVTYTLPNSRIDTMHWEVQRVRNKEMGSEDVLGVGVNINTFAENMSLLRALVQAMGDQSTQINRFNYIISHHIRRHSVNMLGLLDLISLSQDSAADTAEYIQYLSFSATKLDQLIKDLSECINLKLPQACPLEAKNLSKFVDRVLKLLNPSIEKGDVNVEIDVDRKHTVSIYAEYMYNILLNVIGNAIKFADQSRSLILRISSTQSGEYVVLSISDNGLGMDLKKVREKLFSFYETFHIHPEGRGIGLHLSNIQMEQMGGMIEVDSSVGVGSVFKLYFRK